MAAILISVVAMFAVACGSSSDEAPAAKPAPAAPAAAPAPAAPAAPAAKPAPAAPAAPAAAEAAKAAPAAPAVAEESTKVASTMAEGEEIVIYYVVHGGITHPFWKTVERGAKDAESHLPDVKVVYTGPSAYNLVEFLAMTEAALNANPDALVVTITEPDAMDEPLRAALDDGLPIIGVNAPDLRQPVESRIPIDTYVGEDSYFIGVVAARETLKRVTPTRGFAANHAPGAAHIHARAQGYVDVFEAEGIPVEIVDVTEDDVKAAEITAAYLKGKPDTNALWLSSPTLSEVIIKRLTDDGLVAGQDFHVAAMDINPTLLDMIADGRLMFTLDQQQYLQGYLGVLFAYLKVKYDLTPPPNPVSTGPAVIGKADVAGLKPLVEAGFR